MLIVSDDLFLKKAEIEDGKALFELIKANRNFLNHYLPWVDKTHSSKDVEEYLRDAERRGMLCFLIRHQGQIVGMAGLPMIDFDELRGELGFWIAENKQGLGIATRVCQMIIQYAFDVMKLHRLEMRCSVENEKSNRIAKALGFSKEAKLKDAAIVNKKFTDAYLYFLISDK
jgi:ribosomal-protein-serine acetyltransferase